MPEGQGGHVHDLTQFLVFVKPDLVRGAVQTWSYINAVNMVEFEYYGR